jgi:hypothetical protein
MLYPLDHRAKFSIAAVDLLPTQPAEGSARGIREPIEDLGEQR